MTFFDFFPLMTDDLVEEFLTLPPPEGEIVDYRKGFRVAQRIGVRANSKNLVGVSLFFKPRNQGGSGGDVVLTERVLKNPHAYGFDFPFNPWSHYVEPLLQYGKIFSELDQDFTTRVYLANDMTFLADRLAEYFEVFVMEDASISSAPGMLWRHLGLEDHYGTYTMIDADMYPSILDKLMITRLLEKIGVSTWRVPVLPDFRENIIMYRPMAGCYWGSSATLPVSLLLPAFRWAAETGRIEQSAKSPISGEMGRIFGAEWPNYGYDEFFLTTCLFPRLATTGTLSLIRRQPRSCYLPYDLMHCISACGKSQISHELDQYITTSGEGILLPKLIGRDYKRTPKKVFYRSQIPA